MGRQYSGWIFCAVFSASIATSALLAADLPAAPLQIGRDPVTLSGIPNVVRLSEKLYSGGLPEGDVAFEALQRLGVKTILSVDGMPPDVERARRFGLRYVHLPFGYDGCPLPRANAIVRAVRDLPGPVFIHCHHGKHRSPAAAAFVRVGLDGLSSQDAVREMERAGTGKNYRGLYADVLAYRAPTPQELSATPADFPTISPTAPLVASMVDIEKHVNRLHLRQKAGWPATERDSSSQDALLLRELYTESLRSEAVRKRGPEFVRLMSQGEQAGRELERALRRGDTETASMALGRIAGGCGSCHSRFRDVPASR